MAKMRKELYRACFVLLVAFTLLSRVDHTSAADPASKITEEELQAARVLMLRSYQANKFQEYARWAAAAAERLRQSDRRDDAEKIYLEALAAVRETLGERDIIYITLLSQLGGFYSNINEHGKAIKTLKATIDAIESVRGLDDPWLRPNYIRLSLSYSELLDYKDAEACARKALFISRQHFGGENVETAWDLGFLGDILANEGRFEEADTILGEALQIREAKLGKDNPATINLLGHLYKVRRRAGRIWEAIQVAENAVSRLERLAQKDPLTYAIALGNLGDAYNASNQFSDSECYTRQAIEVVQTQLSANDPLLETLLGNLEVLYRATARLKEADDVLNDLLKRTEQRLGQNHPQVAALFTESAMLKLDEGDAKAALPLVAESTRILDLCDPTSTFALRQRTEETRGLALCNLGRLDDSLGVFKALLRNLQRQDNKNLQRRSDLLKQITRIYWEKGDSVQAERTNQEIAAVERQLGIPPSLMEVDYAMFLSRTGNFSRARDGLQHALSVGETIYGPSGPMLGPLLTALGVIAGDQGDWAAADAYYRRCLDIYEKAFGKNSAKSGAVLANRARLLFLVGDFSGALQLYQQSLTIDVNTLGADSFELAATYNNVGETLSAIGKFDEAVVNYQKAYTLSDRKLGKQHRTTLGIASNLAGALVNAGRGQEGGKVLNEALSNAQIAPDLPLDNARVVSELYNYAGLVHYLSGDLAGGEQYFNQALSLRETVLPPNHPELRPILRNLALLELDLNHWNESLKLARRISTIDENALANVLSFSSEAHRLSFYYQQHMYDFLPTYGVAADIAQSVIRTKGIVLDSLLEDNAFEEAAKDPRARKTLEELRRNKEELGRTLFDFPDQSKYVANTVKDNGDRELKEKCDRLESELMREVAGAGLSRAAQQVTTGQVQEALGNDQVLVDYLRYNHYCGKNVWERRYGALIIANGKEPVWIQLGSAGSIEKTIKACQELARGSINDLAVLNSLWSQVWAPIDQLLPKDIKRVVVCPDAELNFVSFAALVGADGKFVAQKFLIKYVASARDLLKSPAKCANRAVIVYANPAFEDAVSSPTKTLPMTLATRSIGLRDFRQVSLRALPGTEVEARAVQDWGKRFNYPVEVHSGANATKRGLSTVESPWILHLATHGFFLPETDLGDRFGSSQTAAPGPKPRLVNPMQRSGLALAGAEKTLEAWEKGQIPPRDNDGILTAEEVASLKLKNTWLVVLSACDTGLGEARAGEGVLGLRRSFVQSGAQNLLMTLWPIGDKITVQMMLNFYKKAAVSGNAPEALAEVQRDWLIKLSRDFNTLAAFRLAGAFIISSQGNQ